MTIRRKLMLFAFSRALSARCFYSDIVVTPKKRRGKVVLLVA